MLKRTRIAPVVASTTAGLALLAAGYSGPGFASDPGDSDTPSKGGTLRMVGSSDVDHMDTASAYTVWAFTLERMFTRQLYTYPDEKNIDKQAQPVPDLATAMPKISNDGKTYTVTIRKGAKWDTDPARQVTAEDVARGFKRLCNPRLPSGGLGYYTPTIKGMKSYCASFLKSSPDVPAMKKYIQTHDIEGIKVLGKRKVQFTLTHPVNDFINILSASFASPAPKEYLAYKPDGPKFRKNTISDGPYKIVKYVPNQEIDLKRNPAWDKSTDNVRHAYVDQVKITEGVDNSVTSLQRIDAGSADLFWDQTVPPIKLAMLRRSKSDNLIIGPDAYSQINPYMVINLHSPNNDGALKKLKVREALEYAVNKVSVAQKYGGRLIQIPLNQAIPKGSVGHIKGFNPYPTPHGQGDPDKAKKLLKQAGYEPGQIKLKMPYRPNSVHPQVATTLQYSLKQAGFDVQLKPVSSGAAFYAQYLENPSASKNGAWDIATPGWVPDWLGNNGRATIAPLFDGRNYREGSTDYGGYNNKKVNKDIDKAEGAPSAKAAEKYWQHAARQVMKDAAIVPIGAQKTALYASSRLHGCVFLFLNANCDPTNVWIEK